MQSQDSKSSSEDELDKLTKSFEEQASKDLQRIRQQNLGLKSDRPKSMRELTKEGLQSPIPEESRGFKMLASMGYVKGQGLGKHKTGRQEPVEIEIMEKRSGLGVEEDRKKRRREAATGQNLRAEKRQQLGRVMQKDFAKSQAAKLSDRRYTKQLPEARKVIETLDRRKGYEQSFLWPPPQRAEDPESDLEASEEQDAEAPPEASAWEQQPMREKLVTALTYLRSQHNYCLHCGCQYDSPEDLAENCPGLMDEDH